MWGGVLAVLAAFGVWRLISPEPGTLEADLSNLDGSPDEIRRLAYEAGLPDDWADFLVAKAWVESRWNPYSARGLQPPPSISFTSDPFSISFFTCFRSPSFTAFVRGVYSESIIK